MRMVWIEWIARPKKMMGAGEEGGERGPGAVVQAALGRVWIEAAELVSVVSAVGKGIGVGRVGTGVGRGAT